VKGTQSVWERVLKNRERVKTEARKRPHCEAALVSLVA